MKDNEANLRASSPYWTALIYVLDNITDRAKEKNHKAALGWAKVFNLMGGDTLDVLEIIASRRLKERR